MKGIVTASYDHWHFHTYNPKKVRRVQRKKIYAEMIFLVEFAYKRGARPTCIAHLDPKNAGELKSQYNSHTLGKCLIVIIDLLYI